jgi:hypothetical protein
MEVSRAVKAEIGGVIKRGELVERNDKTVLVRFPGGKGGEPFVVKRHIIKHRVKFIKPGWETL